jgi:hypothetical protein
LIEEEDLKICLCMGEINTFLVHDGSSTNDIHGQHKWGEDEIETHFVFMKLRCFSYMLPSIPKGVIIGMNANGIPMRSILVVLET